MMSAAAYNQQLIDMKPPREMENPRCERRRRVLKLPFQKFRPAAQMSGLGDQSRRRLHDTKIFALHAGRFSLMSSTLKRVATILTTDDVADPFVTPTPVPHSGSTSDTGSEGALERLARAVMIFHKRPQSDATIDDATRETLADLARTVRNERAGVARAVLAWLRGK
jgi:hypothetical protein